jgi:hypothetical protein
MKLRILIYKLLVTLAMLTLSGFTQAQILKHTQEYSEFVIGNSAGADLQLEIRQMPLDKVLENISQKTGIPIHFAVLPEGLVTARCVANTLKPVLECLLNKKADLIVRYAASDDKLKARGQIAEAWVLGSRLERPTTNLKEYISSAGQAETFLAERKKNEEIEQLKEKFIKNSQSSDAGLRAEAVGALLGFQKKGDPEIIAVLEQALTDQNAQVRAQAISTYAHLEGNRASGAIRHAMLDSSVDVRMMAVDGIQDDIELLKHAINDPDQTIRTLASIKLDEIYKLDTGEK